MKGTKKAMPKTLNTSELPLHRFKFVLKSLTESKQLHVKATKFETAITAAQQEAAKSKMALAYAGVDMI